MAVSHRGAISWGLVHVPVGLYTATQPNDIHFNQLCPDGSRVRYKKVCSSCGQEIENKDIIKGFEYEKGKYVTMTDDDFEKAKTEKDKAIHIISFVDLSAIPPIYFDKTYHAIPEAGGDKAFELLRRAMLDTGKIGVGKTVLGAKETLLALIPTDKGILVETLFFADEVKAAPKEPAHPEVSEEELSMARTLISAMDKPFAPEEYHNTYQARLWKIIEAKKEGQEIVKEPEEKPSNVVDLMVALKASVDQAKPKQSTRRRKQA